MFETDDDRLSMLSDFGTEVEIDGRTIIAMLDNDFSDEFGIASSVPVLIARTSDVEDVARDTKLYVDNVQYTVGELQPDGQGMTYIPLQKV